MGASTVSVTSAPNKVLNGVARFGRGCLEMVTSQRVLEFPSRNQEFVVQISLPSHGYGWMQKKNPGLWPRGKSLFQTRNAAVAGLTGCSSMVVLSRAV